MPETNTRQIHLPTYLWVLRQLGGVRQEDVDAAQSVLKGAFANSYETPVTFYEGLWKGDGRINVPRVFKTSTGEDLPSQIVFQESGGVENSLYGFSGRIPSGIAAYFFGGIFGVAEMRYKPSDQDVILQIEGAKLLYECIMANNGNVMACENSEGAQKIGPAKKRLQDRQSAAEQAARDLAAKEEAERVRIEQAKNEIEVAAQKRIKEEEAARQQKVYDQDKAKVEEIWKAAESIREATRGWFNPGDPEDIQKIMDQYARYRYTGNMTQAQFMIRTIAEKGIGKQLFEEKYCSLGEVIRKESCDAGYIGEEEIYRLKCSYGVPDRETRVPTHNGSYKDCSRDPFFDRD